MVLGGGKEGNKKSKHFVLISEMLCLNNSI